ncbi:aldo/keto reductase [Comamonas testosteroni]|uniref:aldo/keto reductase n=1 Tax=Comamonas testosteroni TaxID=285 RepID=UPI002E127FF9|nr:aldo/keto reductase [Comamonas testosteroni]
MQLKTLGRSLQVSALGLGCMGMSEFYGPRDDEQSLQTLNWAVDHGVNFFDTADGYGHHHNEELLAQFLRGRSQRVKIATKFGIVRKQGDYTRSIDSSPAYARASCEASLQRLGVEQIDLFYVHRINSEQAIEDTMQELARLVQEGKIAHIGLSEVSAATLRRAHAVHPVTAVQTEYSLFTRDVEVEVLPTCRELGIGLVPYSPLGRGFLTGRFQHQTPQAEGDFRLNLPRFQAQNIDANRALVDAVITIAQRRHCSPAQIALAWLLAQGEDIVPIPGTTRIAHLADKLQALQIHLEAQELTALEQLQLKTPVAGARYSEEGMKGVNA